MANKPTTTTTTVAIAPAHPVGVGKATAGGHVTAWRGQPAFATSATLSLVSAVNPWRAGTPGAKFYAAVLAPTCPPTVQAAIALGAAAGFNAAAVQGHLRWLYTWGGAYLQVNGTLYAGTPLATQQVQPAPVAMPKQPKQPKRAKLTTALLAARAAVNSGNVTVAQLKQVGIKALK